MRADATAPDDPASSEESGTHASRRPRQAGAALAALMVLAGCASVPTAEEYRAGTVVPATPAVAPARDGRARFREIFCGLLHRNGTAPPGDPRCDGWLWRLADEPAPAPPAPLPAVRPELRAFVVTGAFSDCFDEHALAFHSAVPAVAARGHRVEVLAVSGRSSVEHNARQIAAALSARGVRPGDRLVLVGYSKGALDALEFLVAHPDAAAQVAAVVSVAGPVLGSPAAGAGRGVYAIFDRRFADRCDPGDGGVLDSLAPARRALWLANNALPPGVAYFSLAAFTTRERLAAGAWPAWRYLAAHDRWNDGQVAAAGAVIPGATLLGFANADHWGVALDIEVSLPQIARRRDPVPFPREALLEAILLSVGEALDAPGATR